jgi:hypothetical protein
MTQNEIRNLEEDKTEIDVDIEPVAEEFKKLLAIRNDAGFMHCSLRILISERFHDFPPRVDAGAVVNFAPLVLTMPR